MYPKTIYFLTACGVVVGFLLFFQARATPPVAAQVPAPTTQDAAATANAAWLAATSAAFDNLVRTYPEYASGQPKFKALVQVINEFPSVTYGSMADARMGYDDARRITELKLSLEELKAQNERYHDGLLKLQAIEELRERLADDRKPTTDHRP